MSDIHHLPLLGHDMPEPYGHPAAYIVDGEVREGPLYGEPPPSHIRLSDFVFPLGPPMAVTWRKVKVFKRDGAWRWSHGCRQDWLGRHPYITQALALRFALSHLEKCR